MWIGPPWQRSGDGEGLHEFRLLWDSQRSWKFSLEGRLGAFVAVPSTSLFTRTSILRLWATNTPKFDLLQLRYSAVILQQTLTMRL